MLRGGAGSQREVCLASVAMTEAARIAGVPEARREPALRRYPLRRLRLPVGAGQLSLVIPDEAAWVREGTWAPGVVRGKEPPYWLRIWPAALATARAVARATSLQGCRVLDLGCGLGVPGITAVQRGAAVTFADVEADALAFAGWNARNQPGRAHEIATVQVDWSREVLDGLFDVVALSDVSYRELHHAPLRRHLSQILAPAGVAVHADPHREASTLFLQSLADHYVMTSWTRPTVIQDRRADVRLTWIARDHAALDAARARFAFPPVAAAQR